MLVEYDYSKEQSTLKDKWCSLYEGEVIDMEYSLIEKIENIFNPR